MRRLGFISGLLIFAQVGFAAPGAAQEPAAVPEGYETGFHIVRPGESLRGITKNYLGTEQLWESNWRLNPTISNPDFLRPGARLQVLLRPQDAVPSAQVVSVSGDVDARPDPIAWTPALRYDLMVESDGIRTSGKSSAALRFTDDTNLVLTEESIVFLKVAGRTLRGIETRSIEIVEGQADLAAAGVSEESPEIEIVVGDATTRPKPGAGGTSEARLRKSETGSAQFMIYEGASEVQAGGKTVAVAEGMGTSVPEGAPPSPPEKLLPAPTMVSPEPGGWLELANLQFSWKPVEGADRYVVEVCRDDACEALVTRAVDLASTTWSSTALPVEDLRWRVTAVSPSGLDGYPAAARPFSVIPERPEFDVPTASFALFGVSVDRTLEGEKRTFYSSTASVAIDVTDPSGVAFWEPLVDGKDADAEDLSGGWAHGEHTVTVLAEDELGNRGEAPQALSFAVDTRAPKLSWRIGDLELLEDVLAGADLELPEARLWLKKGARRNARRARDNRPPEWTLVAWGNEKVGLSRTLEQPGMIRGLYRDYRGVRLQGEAPVLVILAPGIRGRGVDGESGSGTFLVLEATDAWAGIEDLTLVTVGSETEGYRLRASCRDRLGNATSAYWSFE